MWSIHTVRGGREGRHARSGSPLLAAADGGAADHQLDAAVLLSAGGGGVRSHRIRLAEAGGADRTGAYTLGGQEGSHGGGAAIRELLVVVGRAGVVGVAIHLDGEAGVGLQNA